MKTTAYSLFALWACMGVVSLAAPIGADCAGGDAAGMRDDRTGISPERVDAAKRTCHAAGLDPDQIAALFKPVSDARAEALPSDCIFLKIEEGLAKGAPPAAVRAAAEKRLAALRRAEAMVSAVREGRGRQHAHLLTHICLALESGLSEEAIAAALARGPFRYGRLIHVIEAGETMRLEGLDSAEVGQVMVDCLDHGLTRPEVFRVARLVMEKNRGGTSYAAMRTEIWDSAH